MWPTFLSCFVMTDGNDSDYEEMYVFRLLPPPRRAELWIC
ncbi:MAG: hypothetical protein MG2_1142 [uncultured Candidatus Poseidoniales archaeon]|nr:MAG: hypothetical protein MG2_1142 [uncultured Candidatus Poseidoniales archaeon]